MKRKMAVLFTMFLLCCMCQAQQVVSSGGFNMNGEVTVDWVIGGSLTDLPVAQTGAANFVIKEELNEDGIKLKVFPNPAHDLLNIELTPADTVSIVVELFDGLGKKVLSKTHGCEAVTQVDLHDFAQGLYILKIFYPGNDLPLWVGKIVKE